MAAEREFGVEQAAQDGTDGIMLQRRGTTQVLVLDHPPANALTSDMIAALSEALQAAVADPGVLTIMLIGAGRGFSAGMDPRSFGQPAVAAALGAFALAVEGCPKPVTAVIHGTCLGAGLELAMACHWRLAAPSAQFGLPEVHLGLSPGSGGSQRLPRLIGGSDALRMLLDGLPLAAAEAQGLGLVDELASGEIFRAGLDFAASRPEPRPTSARPGPSDLYGPKGALAQARARLAGQPVPAPHRIVDIIEAASLLPFDQGLVVEATTFAELAAGEAAQGLRAAWEAERRAALPPNALAGVPAPKVEVLGLWHPGAAGIAAIQRALVAGMAVILTAANRDALVEVLNQVAAWQDQRVAEGRLTEADRDAEWARLSASVGAAALAGADVILTAATSEQFADRSVAPGGLAGEEDGPGIVFHDSFAEIAIGKAAEPVRAARALALARRLGLRGVFTGPGGPVLSRLERVMAEVGLVLEAGGTSPALIADTLAAWRAGRDLPRGGEAVLRAALSALVVEGLRLVESGTLRRPGDADAIAVLSGLVPRWQGGPMAWADRLGLLVLRADLWARAEAEPTLYSPPALIDRQIAEGRSLSSLNVRR